MPLCVARIEQEGEIIASDDHKPGGVLCIITRDDRLKIPVSGIVYELAAVGRNVSHIKYVDVTGRMTEYMEEFSTRWRGVHVAIATLPQPIAEEIIPEILLGMNVIKYKNGGWRIDKKCELVWMY